MSDWISVNDRVPKEDKEVLVRVLRGLDCCPTKHPFSEFVALDELRFYVDYGQMMFGHEAKMGCLVTHWCEIPIVKELQFSAIRTENIEERLLSRELIKLPSGECKTNPVFIRKKKLYDYLNGLKEKNHKWIDIQDQKPIEDCDYLIVESMGIGVWWASSISYKEWLLKHFNRKYYYMKFPDCLISANKFTERLPPPNTWIVIVHSFLFNEETYSVSSINTGKRDFTSRGIWPFEQDHLSVWFECPLHPQIDKNNFTLI